MVLLGHHIEHYELESIRNLRISLCSKNSLQWAIFLIRRDKTEKGIFNSQFFARY
jgi:hypothetical protein